MEEMVQRKLLESGINPPGAGENVLRLVPQWPSLSENDRQEAIREHPHTTRSDERVSVVR
jgi:hypothetical protein